MANFKLSIELIDVHKPVWRRVVVPDLMSLASLHLVIQQAMGWDNKHLFEFVIQGGRLSEDTNNLDTTLIKEVFSQKVTTIQYIYDFGDYWQHQIYFEGVALKLAETLVIEREGECPPEDIGGPPGYEKWCQRMGV
jgi:hypothetical protein